MDKTIWSKTRSARYTNFSLSGNSLSFERVNTGQNWKLDIGELFELYKKHSFINTTIVKKATGGRVNSPSIAILMAIGCIDSDGNRI